jgi:hypothetical protein
MGCTKRILFPAPGNEFSTGFFIVKLKLAEFNVQKILTCLIDEMDKTLKL